GRPVRGDVQPGERVGAAPADAEIRRVEQPEVDRPDQTWVVVEPAQEAPGAVDRLVDHVDAPAEGGEGGAGDEVARRQQRGRRGPAATVVGGPDEPEGRGLPPRVVPGRGPGASRGPDGEVAPIVLDEDAEDPCPA